MYLLPVFSYFCSWLVFTLETKLITAPWRTLAKQRIFFEDYATQRSFDAMNPENWYSQSRDKIMSAKVPPLLCFLVSLVYYFALSVANFI